MNVLVYLKRRNILLLFIGVLHKCQLGQLLWYCCAVFCILTDFCLPVLSITGRGMLNSLTILFLLSLLSYILFCFMYFEAQILGLDTQCYVFLKNWLFSIMKCLFISGNVACSEVYFYRNVAILAFFWLKSTR